MVEFDLRKLSAPLEALRTEVDSAYERLDAKWNEIAIRLRKLPIPCTIGFTYSESPHDDHQYYRLEWRKWKGKRRFCITYNSLEIDHNTGEPIEHEDVTPYEEWGAEQRIEMLTHVPDLFREAVNQVKAFIASTLDAEVSK